MWNDEARNFAHNSQSVFLVNNGIVIEYHGEKFLSTDSSTTLKRDADMPESRLLRFWYDEGGRDLADKIPKTSSQWMTFGEAEIKNSAQGDEPFYFQLNAFKSISNRNVTYKACKNAKCNKMVVEQPIGHYTCEKCQTNGCFFKHRMHANSW